MAEFTKQDIEEIRTEKYSDISKFEYSKEKGLLFVESIEEGNNKCIDIYTTNDSNLKAKLYPNHPKLLYRPGRDEITQTDLLKLIEPKYDVEVDEFIEMRNEYFILNPFEAQRFRANKYSRKSKFDYVSEENLLFVTAKGLIEIYDTENSSRIGKLNLKKSTINYEVDDDDLNFDNITEIIKNKYGITPIIEEETMLSILQSINERSSKDCYQATQAYWEYENIITNNLHKKHEEERIEMIPSQKQLDRRFTI